MNEVEINKNESQNKIIEDNNNKNINEKILNDEDNLSYDKNLNENKNVENININDKSMTYEIKKNLILYDENEFNQKQNNEREYLSHYGNIGRNIVVCNTYVLGIRSSLILFIFTFLGMILTFLAWILSNNNFYSKYIYIIGSIPFSLTQIFFILCFLTEPGIIPRNDPDFLEKHEVIDNNLKKEYISNTSISTNYNKESNINNNIIEKEDIQIKGKANKEKNGNSSIPYIFTERKCSTCNIIKPPRASHCRYCDDCILNLDHHCFFISNCVGERNHKYFYLFLSFGSISAIYITNCCLIVILYIFIIKPQNIWIILFLNDKWFIFLCIILISISVIYACLGSINIYILLGPSGVGFLIFTFLFYKYKPNNYESFRNPFSIPTLIASVQFGVFVIANFIKQTKTIGSGLTIKQNSSIQKEIINYSLDQKNIEFDKDYLSKKNIKEQFKNIIIFLIFLFLNLFLLIQAKLKFQDIMRIIKKY